MCISLIHCTGYHLYNVFLSSFPPIHAPSVIFKFFSAPEGVGINCYDVLPHSGALHSVPMPMHASIELVEDLYRCTGEFPVLSQPFLLLLECFRIF